MPSSTAAARPSGGAATRSAIQLAAAALFAEQGFGATSVRDIARASGADPALVIRYFGSKEALFLETMSIDGDFAELLEGSLEDLGRRVVERLVSRGDVTRRLYTALLRAADREEVRAYLARLTATRLVDPLVERLAGPDARVRAQLVAAQIGGLLNSLWNVRVPELVDAADADIVRIYGTALQHLIDGD